MIKIKNNYTPAKGDLIWLNFQPQTGKEIAKRRQVLVLSPKEYNKHGLVIAVPITSKVKGYPFEVKIEYGEIKGAILADSIKNLDWKERKAEFILVLPKEKMIDVLKLLSLLLKP